MKEMTDQELTDKISQVFENFEDPGAASGWQELQKKYPENNRFLLLWWGAAAAVLLIVCSLWFFTPVSNGSDEMVNATSKQKQSEIGEKQTGLKLQDEEKPQNGITAQSEEPEESSEYGIQSSREPSIVSRLNTHNGQIESATQIHNNHELQAARVSTEVSNTPLLTGKEQIASTILPEPVNDPISNVSTSITRDSVTDLNAKILALTQTTTRTDRLSPEVKNVSNASQKASTGKSAFSFYAGSFFNYSTGSETKLNFGAGFTSDIKLASNLKLSTGLALANNSLTYNDGKPSSTKDNMSFRSIPAFAPASGNNNLTTITKYDANLLALEIPINLKYLIIPKDNKLYLMAGLSSGTYLAETYSLDYRNYSPAGAFVNQTQDIEEKKQLQTFDLARTLNISFGYSSKFGKNQNITIEPFLKYPLGGLGSEDLKFGSTGVNLKLNFSQFKKQ